MRRLFYAGAAAALCTLTGCGRLPAPAAPSGKGWSIQAEGSTAASMLVIPTSSIGVAGGGSGRVTHGGNMVVMWGARLNDGASEKDRINEQPPSLLTVGHNVSETTFHVLVAPEKP